MKKFFLSFFVIAGSAGYILSTYMGGNSAAASTTTVSTAQIPDTQTTQTVAAGSAGSGTGDLASNTPTPAKQNSAPASQPSSQPVAPTPTPAPAPAPKPRGQYVDGTYTGSTADAYYGYVQVEATISGGKLTNVAFLQYPNDRRTSIEINSQAMPMLKQEAIAAQSANVSGVSGASDTSAAFVESLGSALSKAKA